MDLTLGIFLIANTNFELLKHYNIKIKILNKKNLNHNKLYYLFYK